jgi:prophage antirepressor-like protein
MSEKIYTVIPESKNIIVTLINSINNDDTFRKHVNKLSESTKQQDQKKAQLINNTIQKIKVFNTKVNPLFLAKDIGVLMGISHINYLIKKFDPDDKITGYITQNDKIKKVTFLTKYGMYRCFWSSKSPLARMFRKFMCKLIDHMIENESDIVDRLSIKFQLENEKLIERGMTDLKEKMATLENKYEDEYKKTALLQLQCANERKKRQDAENENNEIDIINSYNMMHIEQLKKEKDAYQKKIQNIRDNNITDEMDSMDLMELKLIKEKYMKPLYIYILHPAYFKKVLKTRQKEIQQMQSNIGSFDIPIIEDTTESMKKTLNRINNLINDDKYESNFKNIFAKNEIFIEPDEILYISFNFGRNIAKTDKLILINTQWIVNKVHYSKICNSLQSTCDMLYLHTKLHVFKTSLEEINDTIREEFVSLIC